MLQMMVLIYMEFCSIDIFWIIIIDIVPARNDIAFVNLNLLLQ